MKNTAILTALSVVALMGCANFSTTQKDITYDATTGNKTREITTQAKSSTKAASKSNLANFKASQSDKTQGASVGSLSQEANSAALVEAAARGTAQGLSGKK